jgi:cytochrome c oxidase subunit II
MNAERMEKAFLVLSGGLLGAFLLALLYATVGHDIQLPGDSGTIIPAEVRQTPPFDNPGLREIEPGRYEAVVLGVAWSFQPNEIRIPAGSEVTFIMTATDLIHGFNIEGTTVNAMLIPGQITRVTHTFRNPGEHLIICHEYCGILHHTMYGKVIVE